MDVSTITFYNADAYNAIIINDVLKPIVESLTYDSVNGEWHSNKIAENLEISKIIFNGNATIVFFKDGTKSLVKCSNFDKFDHEHAVIYAIVKRLYGKVDPKTNLVSGGAAFVSRLQKMIAEAEEIEAKTVKKRGKKQH